MTDAVTKVFNSAEGHLKQLCENLQDAEKKSKVNENFSLQEFWLKLDNAAGEVSQTSTQIAMAFTKAPNPSVKDSQDLMNGLEATCDNLVSVFHTLPDGLGRYFHNDISKLVREILRNLIEFVQSLDMKGSKGTRERLKCAGQILTACEKVQKAPKNNLESALNFLQSEELLLLDALYEIDEEVKSDFSAQKSGQEIDNTEMWNNQDRELLPPCVGLVKTARSTLKKVICAVKANGDCKSAANIIQMDNVLLIVEDLSPAVDTFVAAIYPPMNQKVVKRAARHVVNIIQNLLNQCKNSHFVKEEDQKWLNFLLKAVDHNNNKLQPLFSQEVSNDCTDSDNSDDEEDDDDEAEEENEEEEDGDEGK